MTSYHVCRLSSVLAAVVVFCSACVTNEAKAPQSPLEYGNGEKYRTDDTVLIGSIPVSGAIERRDHDTAVSGHVLIANADKTPPARPLKFAKVVLRQGTSIVASSTSDEHGAFRVEGLLADGPYHLEIETAGYDGEREVDIHGYEIKDADLVAEPKAAGQAPTPAARKP